MLDLLLYLARHCLSCCHVLLVLPWKEGEGKRGEKGSAETEGGEDMEIVRERERKGKAKVVEEGKGEAEGKEGEGKEEEGKEGWVVKRDESDNDNVPFTLLLRLLQQPLYRRSSQHLDPVSGLYYVYTT